MAKFQILAIDCPWIMADKLSMSNVKRGAAANYNVMSIKDIQQLKIGELAADNAVMALWVPSALMREGLDTMLAYGFDFKQTWIWTKVKMDPFELLKKEIRKKSFKDVSNKRNLVDLKDIDQLVANFDLNNILNFGLGHIARNVHEVALIGTRGKVSKFIKNKSQRTVFFHQNFKHSQKPEILQDRLELIFPEFKNNCLEIFGRRERQGWIVIGNEVNGTLPNSPDKEDIHDSIDRLIKL